MMLTNKEKYEFLINSSSLWTIKDIQKYFNLSYPSANKIKKETIKKYGSVGSHYKLLRVNIFKTLNTTFEEELKNLELAIKDKKK